MLGIAFIRPIARLMGASESIMEDCVLYGRVNIAFTTAFMLQNVFQSFLVVAERPRVGLLVVVAAGVANMVLDALFIAVFHWGLAGAALATGIGQCIGGVIPMVYILRRKDLPLRFVPFRFEAPPDSSGLRQRFFRVYEQHFHVVCLRALQHAAHAHAGRGRRFGLRRADVCAADFYRHGHRLQHRQRADRQLSLRRGSTTTS